MKKFVLKQLVWKFDQAHVIRAITVFGDFVIRRQNNDTFTAQCWFPDNLCLNDFQSKAAAKLWCRRIYMKRIMPALTKVL